MVIGIIAAITVPVIMSNYRKKETATGLKKIYSSVMQAIKQTEIEQGVPIEQLVLKENQPQTESDFDKYFAKYFNTSNSSNYRCSYDNSCEGILQLSDGSQILRWYHGIIYVDVNGIKGPNRVGVDRFDIPVKSSGVKSRESLLEYCKGGYPCSSNNCYPHDKARACFELIRYDGWEIKDDYPNKI